MKSLITVDIHDADPVASNNTKTIETQRGVKANVITK